MVDRQHQESVRQRFRSIASGNCTDTSTLLDVCPGGGKSKCVTIAVEELRNENRHAGLIWFVPRASLAAQSRKGFNAYAKAKGLPLELEAVRSDKHGIEAKGPRSAKGFAKTKAPFGFVTTYQRFTSKRAKDYAKSIATAMGNRRGVVLLALDELHHCTAEDTQSWTHGVNTLKRELQLKGVELHFLNMSGTLYRKDQQQILHVLYKDGEPQADVSYSLVAGRSEKAVIPPEVVYVDGPVVIKRNENIKAYERLRDIPKSYQAKVLKAFLTGTILKPAAAPDAAPEAGASVEFGRDSREVTSLWLMKYGMEHYIAKRQELNYPLQTIVVAHSAAAALGYTGWLRRNYPEIKTALSLSSKAPSDWGHSGFKHVHLNTLVDLNGGAFDAAETLDVMGQASETSAVWYEDPQCQAFGVPAANYDLELTPPDMRGDDPFVTNPAQQEWNNLPIGEQVIRAFQSPPINGDNIIDVLVTVGKAYEGLDAPRCSHLICLARHRSAPWLSQCFARSWRYDYELAKAGVEDQRCWIFVPADALMVDAVERIVWNQPLAGGSLTAPPGDEEAEMAEDDQAEDEAADDGTEVTFASPEELEAAWRQEHEDMINLIAAQEAAAAELAAAEELAALEDGEEPADEEEEEEELDTPEADEDEEELPEEKPPVQVKAFNIIDRVRHEFVNDTLGAMEVVKEERVEHHILV
jgi:superfamily II DNA or RNA helicase